MIMTNLNVRKKSTVALIWVSEQLGPASCRKDLPSCSGETRGVHSAVQTTFPSIGNEEGGVEIVEVVEVELSASFLSFLGRFMM